MCGQKALECIVLVTDLSECCYSYAYLCIGVWYLMYKVCCCHVKYEMCEFMAPHLVVMIHIGNCKRRL